jgi:hypothetical protein
MNLAIYETIFTLSIAHLISSLFVEGTKEIQAPGGENTVLHLAAQAPHPLLILRKVLQPKSAYIVTLKILTVN